MLLITIIITLINYHYIFSHDCSRMISRKIRNYINNDLYSNLKINKEMLLDQCPLHSSLDIYQEQESHIHMNDNGYYQCSYCNKRFISQYYIDRHLDNYHNDKILTNSTVCLADYCPIFGCKNNHLDVVKPIKLDIDYDNEIIKKKFKVLDKCTKQEIEVSIQSCKDVATS